MTTRGARAMAPEPVSVGASAALVIIGGLAGASWWFLDKVLGALIEDRAQHIFLYKGQPRSFVERMARKLDEIETQDAAKTELLERMISERDKYYYLWLEEKRLSENLRSAIEKKWPIKGKPLFPMEWFLRSSISQPSPHHELTAPAVRKTTNRAEILENRRGL